MDELDEKIKKHLLQEKEISKEEVPPALIRRAQALKPARVSAVCPHCGKAITPFRDPLAIQQVRNGVELTSAFVFFVLSFVFPHYFMQFLAAAALAGIKWIVDRKATRTQILVYKALREGSDEPSPVNRIKEGQVENLEK